MNEEILSGLKTAKERGFKIEDSVQSFINAGYSPTEVKEAAAFLSRGFSPLPSTPKEAEISSREEQKPKEPEMQKQAISKRTKWIIIILVILVVLGIVIPMLLFKDKFLGVIDSIFP